MTIENLLPISVIILAHQENELLHHAIASVPWADEVFVVWNGKGTPNIPTSVRVLYSPLPLTDFAAQRNKAMKQAKHDWVFFLDSDEEFTKTSFVALTHLLRQQHTNGAFVRRVDVFLKKKLRFGETGKKYFLRIFRKQHGKFIRPVHEYAEVDGKVDQTEIVLLHSAHESISEFLNSVVTYAKQDAQLRISNHEHVSMFALFIWPIGKFFDNYVRRLGFLDGWRGLIYAVVMSFHSFTVRALMYEAEHHD